MASRRGVVWASKNLLMKTLVQSRAPVSSSSVRYLSLVTGDGSRGEQFIGEHTAKWMQATGEKTPMQLINEVPPIEVEGRIVACEGDNNPALGHPIEFICLDREEPAICKYCGIRYVQHHDH